MKSLFVLSAIHVIAVCSLASAEAAKQTSVLSGLEAKHPRLMLKEIDLGRLRASYPDDPELQKIWADVQKDAEGYLSRRALLYEKIGPRLLHVSRDCLGRIYALALAYRWTGDEKYAAKAKENLLQVCAFPDWNPSHFLDTAEMSHAVGVGYDWLFSYLDEATRGQIRAALIEKGLTPGLKVYEKDGGWARSEYNWNQVCNGGMIVGALAIAETDPSYAERIIPAAVKSLPRALKSYGPDGAWGEGPGYWSYATHYTAYALDALDTALQKIWGDVEKDAERCLSRRPLVYEKVGPRLLSVSRDCLGRIYALALAYRWTGDEKYAAKAKENLLQVCAFPDWNPSHFLDTAEMSHAVGVGYDWLFSYLDEGTRGQIQAALIEKGLKPGLAIYEKDGWWVQSEYNWNQVCNGGMIVGALAIAETDPSYAERIIPAAVKSLPRALKSYAPDGAWGEGPGYWSYATHYTAYGLTALDTALGNTFGLLEIDGLYKAGQFPIYTTGPTGLYLNFADVGERSARRPMPCMFWLARTFHNPLYAWSEHEQLASRNASAAHLVWYSARPPARAARRQLDAYFKGPVEVVTMRSAWDDPNALFVGIKAGYNQVNHGHLDLGTFELDALGVRWARDLGSDNYNMPGYWESKRGGQRWSYYRLNSASHNILMLGGKDQDPMAISKLTKVEINGERPLTIVELAEAYKDSARSASRGVVVIEGRRAVLVQDEISLKTPCELAWGMTTDAQIDIEEGSRAVLKLKGQKLVARLLSPTDARFTVESAEQQPPQKRNEGVRRLMMRLPQASGDVRVAVLLAPVWKDGKTVDNTEIKPLANW